MGAQAEREKLAWILADGISGYFQYLHSSGLIEIPGEDTAQYIASHILHDIQKYRIKVSHQPPNWPDGEGKRVDIALCAKKNKSLACYGAIEIKWITDSSAPQAARIKLIQDAARLASVEKLSIPYAKLLVVGFLFEMMQGVFDVPHPRSSTAEEERVLAGKILPRTVGGGPSIRHNEIIKIFPTYQNHVPKSCTWSDRGLKCDLLASTAVMSEGKEVGRFLVWQVNKQ